MPELIANACRFCAIANGSGRAAHDKPWMENDEFVSIISVGALVPGWSLVVPRKHQLNMSRLLEEKSTYDFLDECVIRVESVFGPTAVFEHGCIHEDSKTGCGVGHAHLHVVPLTFDLVEAVLRFNPAVVWRDCKMTEAAEFASGREYLFAASRYHGSETVGSILVLTQEVSQFFRKVIARELGREAEYNYREYKQANIIEQSLSRMVNPQERAA